ncbi:MAG: hypothetical protein C4B59_16285 [Candidatus Methanogaster sp.]|uniref:Uncharacterized protein n=1 Tax=Candidatus Methanogaster sp. TaxID=3386292 RepID=A0AC61KY83_9EURY|nr:MAG: hypothetical protein C4B59_16285 [ANME-2 cluster archaeon]
MAEGLNKNTLSSFLLCSKTYLYQPTDTDVIMTLKPNRHPYRQNHHNYLHACNIYSDISWSGVLHIPTYFVGTGQTPGMKVMNVKPIRTDGDFEIGYGKGFLRWIGMLISALVLCLGFLWILIDKHKRGWYDKIAGVYVVAANR